MAASAKSTYQGHKNWDHWNVSLWIFNDEGLYSLARLARSACPTLDRATERFIAHAGATHTPDGAKYTKSAVRAALANVERVGL
jgi:hypothetical protein